MADALPERAGPRSRATVSEPEDSGAIVPTAFVMSVLNPVGTPTGSRDEGLKTRASAPWFQSLLGWGELV
jgi:hypothetical protein